MRLEFTNIGTGKDIVLLEVEALIQERVGLKGKILFNPVYPAAILGKELDILKMELF